MPRKKKPKKPYPDFPLFPHATGQWAKKIRGRLHYFGNDAQAALKKFLDQRDDLMAGRAPRDPDALTLRDACNHYMTAQKRRLQAGEITLFTFRDQMETCDRLLGFLGKARAVVELRPSDFAEFRVHLAKTRGPTALTNAVVRTRTVFKWLFENDLIDTPVRFGTQFETPPARARRKAKREGGLRMFEAEEIRKLLDVASVQMKAMILLGVNCGFGQSDVASLPLSAVDFERGWVSFPRPKTEEPRRCPLWPETIEAVRAAIASRPKPRHAADSKLAFLTRWGLPWVRHQQAKGDAGNPGAVPYYSDALGKEFQKVLKAIGWRGRGGFYNLRHSFRTAADGVPDEPAIRMIMGHIDESMGAFYRERIDDGRLVRVADAVRGWLWPTAEVKPAEPAAGATQLRIHRGDGEVA